MELSTKELAIVSKLIDLIDYKYTDRVKVKGQAIFGSCLAFTKDGYVLFGDEETNEIRKYKPTELEKSYDK